MVLDPDGASRTPSPSVERDPRREPARQLRRPADDRPRLDAGDRAATSRRPFECTLLAAAAPRASSSCGSRTCSTSSTSAASCSTPATSRERKAFEAELTTTRRSTTRSPAWPTARCSSSARARRSPAARRESRRSPCSSSTSTTSRRSTTRSATRPATSCCVEVAERLDARVRARRHRRAPRRRRVRRPARGRRRRQEAADARRAHPRPRSAAPLALDGQEIALRAQHRHRASRAGDRRDADELLRDADVAMYRAKRDGKGGYRLFEPGDARRRARPPRAARRPRSARRRRRARAALPADRAARRRLRSPASRRCCAGTTRARPGRAGRVHPARRGDRPDRPDRPLGAARGLPPGAPARRPRPAEPLHDERQRLGAQLQHAGLVDDVRDGARRVRPRPGAARCSRSPRRC